MLLLFRRINLQESAIYRVSTLLVILSAVILIYSFVHLDSDNEEIGNFRDSSVLHSKNGTRLVFMVIDAFRLSFMTSENSPMKFIRSSVQNRNAIAFDAFARMPTVTLPRITAYITGTIPSFGTVLTNLATDRIKVDNWVTRLKNHGKRIHFFGDDTWIRLLPEHFAKYDGVTSFFVNDYTEVDHNVTRHLEKELEEKREWDVMILHYLGLDHIGHSLGGLSDKIEGKLEEMDRIVERIVEGLSKANSNTWIVVCGDHGMTQGGSHGGSSNDETRVPVVIWHLGQNKKSQESLESRADLISGKIEQIDVSATIFSIFGLISPLESYGVSLLPELRDYFGKVFDFDPKLQWDHFWNLANKKSLSDVFTLTCHDENECDFSKKFVRETTAVDYRKVQEKLIETASSMPNLQLGIAVFLLILAAGISSKTSRIDYNYFLFTVNLICFASSLIEEEHEIWFYISSTSLYLKLIIFLRQKLQNSSNMTNSIRDLVLVLVLHRIGFGWMQGSRRRWTMDQSVLPPQIFQDVGDFDISDINTIMSKYTLTTIIFSSIVWISLSKRTKVLPVLALLSHWLRFLDLVTIDAYFLSFLRLSIVPIAFLLKKPSSAFLTLVLVVSPPSQLILVAIIYWIGIKSKQLELGNAEITALIMSSFYYTGNSNSLSTLSLTSAYVGLLDYYPGLVGIQLFLSTFSGPIAFLCGFCEKKLCLSFIPFFFMYRVLFFATSLLCLYIFQHHLFVWSVYSPKVTYDLFHTLFSIIVMIFYLFRSKYSFEYYDKHNTK